MLERFREIIEPAADNGLSRVFDLAMQGLILLSIISFSLETIPDLSPDAIAALHYADVILVTIFSVEYIVRVVVAQHRLKFIFSFYGFKFGNVHKSPPGGKNWGTSVKSKAGPAVLAKKRRVFGINFVFCFNLINIFVIRIYNCNLITDLDFI